MNGKKILVVDDTEALAKSLSKDLSTEGFVVQTEGNGNDGYLNAITNHPDVVILDLMLPGMGGLQILENLRKDPWGATVPVIMLTNLDTNDATLQKVIELHPKYYLVKQKVNLQEIIEKVRECLS